MRKYCSIKWLPIGNARYDESFAGQTETVPIDNIKNYKKLVFQIGDHVSVFSGGKAGEGTLFPAEIVSSPWTVPLSHSQSSDLGDAAIKRPPRKRCHASPEAQTATVAPNSVASAETELRPRSWASFDSRSSSPATAPVVNVSSVSSVMNTQPQATGGSVFDLPQSLVKSEPMSASTPMVHESVLQSFLTIQARLFAEYQQKMDERQRSMEQMLIRVLQCFSGLDQRSANVETSMLQLTARQSDCDAKILQTFGKLLTIDERLEEFLGRQPIPQGMLSQPPALGPNNELFTQPLPSQTQPCFQGTQSLFYQTPLASEPPDSSPPVPQDLSIKTENAPPAATVVNKINETGERIQSAFEQVYRPSQTPLSVGLCHFFPGQHSSNSEQSSSLETSTTFTPAGHMTDGDVSMLSSFSVLQYQQQGLIPQQNNQFIPVSSGSSFPHHFMSFLGSVMPDSEGSNAAADMGFVRDNYHALDLHDNMSLERIPSVVQRISPSQPQGAAIVVSEIVPSPENNVETVPEQHQAEGSMQPTAAERLNSTQMCRVMCRKSNISGPVAAVFCTHPVNVEQCLLGGDQNVRMSIADYEEILHGKDGCTPTGLLFGLLKFLYGEDQLAGLSVCGKTRGPSAKTRAIKGEVHYKAAVAQTELQYPWWKYDRSASLSISQRIGAFRKQQNATAIFNGSSQHSNNNVIGSANSSFTVDAMSVPSQVQFHSVSSGSINNSSSVLSVLNLQ